MTRYEITIQRTQGKNKGLSVIYAKKNLSAPSISIILFAFSAVINANDEQVSKYTFFNPL